MHDLGGTIRARTAEATLTMIEPYIKKAGITRLANITGLDSIGLPVFTCIRPNARSLSTSQGKGISDELAMCSAYMEAIEVYYAEALMPEYKAKLEQLKNQNIIEPNTLSAGKFQLQNAQDHSWRWVTGTEIVSQQNYLIPYEAISLDLVEESISHAIFEVSTTGLAGGNTEDEAVLHALYEVIERNCSAQFDLQTNKIDRLLDLSSIDYPHAQALLEKLRTCSVDVAVFDITNEFGIASFHCIIADNNPFRKLGWFSGTGTHHHRGVALCRAISEAVQSRLTHIAGSRDDMFPHHYQMTWQPLVLEGKRLYQQTPHQAFSDLKQQKQALIETVCQQSCEKIIKYNYTNDNEPFSVVRILIPKLVTI